MFNMSESVESFDARRARIAATGINGNGMGTPLTMAVKMAWPTPTVCGNHNRKGASATSEDGLSTAVKRWPTPTASMQTEGDMEQARTAGNSEARQEYKSSGPLNPAWVEQLMGFPDGWTDGPCDQGKRKSPGKRHVHAKLPPTEPQD